LSRIEGVVLRCFKRAISARATVRLRWTSLIKMRNVLSRPAAIGEVRDLWLFEKVLACKTQQ
jgi:hypothetical protein